MPRAAAISRSTTKNRHQPLENDILGPTEDFLPKSKLKARPRRRNDDDDDLDFDSRATEDILSLALLQQREVELEDCELEAEQVLNYPLVSRCFDYDDESNADEMAEMTHEEENAFESLFPASATQRATLADIVLSKLNGDCADTMASDMAQDRHVYRSDPSFGVDPRLVAMFEKLGETLQGRGTLHKSMKILPSLPQWTRFLALTHPEKWSPFMMRKVTNIFMSNMNADQARFFLRHVLLPAVRDDIATPKAKSNRKLDIHLYEACLKALYKPAPFFTGFLFPLIDDGCTLKETIVIASILSKKALPSVHLGAVLIRIAAQDFSGPRSLIMRVLLDKKKDLPFKVLDELVFHFIRVSNGHKKHELPVLWHQSLLVFVQRYSQHLTDDQRN